MEGEGDIHFTKGKSNSGYPEERCVFVSGVFSLCVLFW